jgi:glycosyltransferase involved in cell wall biosynthesis
MSIERQQRISGPSTLALVADVNGCTLWRVWQPCAALQAQGYNAQWGRHDDPRLVYIAHEYDAVILPRLGWPAQHRDRAERWVAMLHRHGIAAIYETDDDLVSDSFGRRMQGLKTDEEIQAIREGVRHTLGMVDGVTCASQRLATLLRTLVPDKPVCVVPNAIDLAWWRSVQAKVARTSQHITIGWAGGSRPDADFAGMDVAWGRIARRYPDVRFLVQGHRAEPLVAAVPPERIEHAPWLPLARYPEPLVNVDIACCPVADTPFNRSKTPIKALEAAASGCAVVATPTLYGQIVTHGETGLLAETADEWEAALGSLIESRELRRRYARRLLRHVEREHTLARNTWRWAAAWGEIVSDFWRRQARPRLVLPADYGASLRAGGITA